MLSNESVNEDNNNAHRREQLLKLVRRLVNEVLTEKQRELIVMYYFEQHSMTEIADTMGLNKSTVSRGIARGLARINDRIQYLRIR